MKSSTSYRDFQRFCRLARDVKRAGFRYGYQGDIFRDHPRVGTLGEQFAKAHIMADIPREAKDGLWFECLDLVSNIVTSDDAGRATS